MSTLAKHCISEGLEGNVIPQTSFAVHVTYTCPLSCAHCCFSSSPKNRDALHVDHIRDVIVGLPKSSDLRLVAFTGGEPFLLGAALDELVKVASGRGFATRVVTSAYWARTPDRAALRVARLRENGLDEMSISWDDFHEEFVSFDRVKNAFSAARKHGITVAISTVQGASSRWTSDRIREELGLEEDEEGVITCETPLNLTGRAEKVLQDAGLRSTRTLGPCPYVVTGPTLSAKNKLLACCGTIPEVEQLILAEEYEPTKYASAIKKATSSVLLNWLYLRGPYDILEFIHEKYAVQVPSKMEVGGNCEACRHLFLSPEYDPWITKALQDRGSEILGELEILDALGLLAPQDILNFRRPEVITQNPLEVEGDPGRIYLPLYPVNE